MSRKIPIVRNNKFFSEEDFQLEQAFGREYMHDINQTAILYRVDRDLTPGDSLYGEAGKDQIKFHAPVEIECIAKIEAPELKSYNSNGGLSFQESGNLTLQLYQQHLDELSLDVIRGDYFGYVVDETTIKYFTVVDNGKINYSNEQTIAGYKSAYRTIICTPTDASEFRGM